METESLPIPAVRHVSEDTKRKVYVIEMLGSITAIYCFMAPSGEWRQFIATVYDDPAKAYSEIDDYIKAGG